MSLVELMISTAILGVMAATVAALAISVQSGGGYFRSTGTATQHARVVLARLEQTMRSAYANEQFPGMHVVATQVVLNGETHTFPDLLVVWTPANGAPQNPTGMPLYGELTMFCPSPFDPTRLVEIRRPASDARQAPALTDGVGWSNLIGAFQKETDSDLRTLTPLMRKASVGEKQRACLRFDVQLRPDAVELAQFRALSRDTQDYLAWARLKWPQDMYSRTTGTRQVWCSTEVHLSAVANGAAFVLPFFGSAALYYDIAK